MRRIITLVVLMGFLMLECTSCSKQEIVVATGEYYEMSIYLPARWENRLDEWDEWLLPPEGQRFVWVYIVERSVSEDPIALLWDDYVLSYTLGGTERYTTTLAATGNNDVYLRAMLDRDYGGVIGEDGHGRRYAFAVPKDAQDFVLEITSMPAVPLTVR